MADVTIGGGHLRIELTVPERVLSLHAATLVVPLGQIRAVRVTRDVLDQVRGFRKPGARYPGVLAVGTWRGTADGHAFHDFVLAQGPGPGVLITTAGKYDRILLGRDDPEQFAADLERARAFCGPLPNG